MEGAELRLDDIPDRLFTPAIKVREIALARPLNINEKSNIQRGTADIRLDPLIGKPYLMKRDDVINNFRYTNDRKIKTGGWVSTKKYVIYREDNSIVMVIQIPLGDKVELSNGIANETKRSKGDYIVCYTNEDGTIDRSSASVVSSAVFRKMCYIPMNGYIEKHLGKISSKFSMRNILNKLGHIPSLGKIKSENNINQNSVNVNSNWDNGFAGYTPINTNQNVPPTLKINNQNIDNRYELIAQVHDSYGKRVGFIIKSVNGNTKTITKQQAIAAALNKKIKNAEAVQEPGREAYLRGSQGSLDSLPIRYM